jgi:hypothetical protein
MIAPVEIAADRDDALRFNLRLYYVLIGIDDRDHATQDARARPNAATHRRYQPQL